MKITFDLEKKKAILEKKKVKEEFPLEERELVAIKKILAELERRKTSYYGNRTGGL